MEKSIETMWKEGFLNNEAIVAPKINNLYNQKSKHIVDKFKKMFKINLIAIVAFSFFILVISFIVGIPYMGVPMFFILNVVAIVNKKLMAGLSKIDNSMNSYEYLTAFSTWIKQQVSINSTMARYYYPLIFLSLILGFWFMEVDGTLLGEAVVSKIIANYPEIYMVNDIPLIGLVGVVLVACLLGYFGGKLYEMDVNVVYGRVFKKLDEILVDMEELRR